MIYLHQMRKFQMRECETFESLNEMDLNQQKMERAVLEMATQNDPFTKQTPLNFLPRSLLPKLSRIESFFCIPSVTRCNVCSFNTINTDSQKTYTFQYKMFICSTKTVQLFAPVPFCSRVRLKCVERPSSFCQVTPSVRYLLFYNRIHVFRKWVRIITHEI